jgi:hypothetical protein
MRTGSIFGAHTRTPARRSDRAALLRVRTPHLQLQQVAPGLKLGLAATVPDTQSGKLLVDYINERVHIKSRCGGARAGRTLRCVRPACTAAQWRVRRTAWSPHCCIAASAPLFVLHTPAAWVCPPCSTSPDVMTL